MIEEGNPLFEELTTSDAKLVSDSKDEAENYADQKWLPDPADAPPGEARLLFPVDCLHSGAEQSACRVAEFRKSKGADVIQLLVSIYDTKEVFVKELQVLLAQRLLLIRDYAFEKEVGCTFLFFGNAKPRLMDAIAWLEDQKCGGSQRKIRRTVTARLRRHAQRPRRFPKGRRGGPRSCTSVSRSGSYLPFLRRLAR